MAIYAQNATVTFGNTTMSEVAAYRVNANPAAVRVGDFGTVEVQSFSQLPKSDYYRFRVLTISHGTTEVFKAGCLCTGVRVDAVVNDVVRFATQFNIAYISRA